MWKKGRKEVKEDGKFIQYLGEWGVTWECKTLMERDVKEWKNMFIFKV
jgi:hypothetical protein